MSKEQGGGEEFEKFVAEIQAKDPETKIGKPVEFQDSTPEEKVQSQEQNVQRIQDRIEGMKKELAVASEGLVLQKEYQSKNAEASKKDDEIIKMVRKQLETNGDPDPAQEALQQEVTQLRAESEEARVKFHSTVPDALRSQDLYIYTERMKEDITKEEDILESNRKELEDMR